MNKEQTKPSETLQKLIRAARAYRQGDRDRARELSYEVLGEPWKDDERYELYRMLMDLFVYIDDPVRFVKEYTERKAPDLKKDSFQPAFRTLIEILDPSCAPENRDEKLTLFDEQRQSLDLPWQRLLLFTLLKHGGDQLIRERRESLTIELRVSEDRKAFSLEERISLLEILVGLLTIDQKSDEFLTQSTELLPRVESPELRARLHYLRGHLFQRDNRLCDAMRSFESGLRHLDGYSNHLTAMIRARLASVYDSMGLARQALHELRAGIMQPGLRRRDQHLLRRVQFEFMLGRNRLEEARQVGDIIFSSDLPPQERTSMLYSFARLYLELKDTENAATYLDQIDVQQVPAAMRGDVFFLRSQIRRAQDKKRDAIDDLKQAIDLTPDSRIRMQRRLLLGKLYRETGLLEEGIKTFKAISEAAPEAVEAEVAVSEMKDLRTDLEQEKLDDVVTVSKKQELLEEIEREIGEKTLFERLRSGLSKTRDTFVSKLETIISRGEIDDDMIDEVEETLILADVGFDTTSLIISKLRKAHREGKLKRSEEIKPFLISEISHILEEFEGDISAASAPPTVVIVIGVNGVGKTTTIAKIAYKFLQDGKSVILAAADTFRAGAIEQISEWGRRLDVEVVKHKSGSDPSAVAYDAVHAALARKRDVLIIDTAGRLHTKVNLMEELKKIRRIVSRECEGAPHEILLVLDATNGQNAISQAKIFKQDLDVSGIILTKLDGTSKGGIIISIVNDLKIPVKFIGVGEKMYDLRPFKAREFVEALFGVDKG